MRKNLFKNIFLILIVFFCFFINNVNAQVNSTWCRDNGRGGVYIENINIIPYKSMLGIETDRILPACIVSVGDSACLPPNSVQFDEIKSKHVCHPCPTGTISRFSGSWYLPGKGLVGNGNERFWQEVSIAVLATYCESPSSIVLSIGTRDHNLGTISNQSVPVTLNGILDIKNASDGYRVDTYFYLNGEIIGRSNRVAGNFSYNTNLICGKSYTYDAALVNGGKEFQAKDPHSFTTPACPLPNTAPTQPTVSAPEYVKSGEQFSIFASTADANGDNVRYNVDWKAGSPITGTSPSSGYVPPTANTEAGHSYTIPISTNITKYTIQVSATDNNTSPKTSATTTKDIIVYNCSAGYYFNTTNKTCTKCSANSYSSAGAITCTQCTPQGATSPAGSTSASACVVPNTAPETPIVTPTTCDPGQEPSPSGTGCTKCLQGTYSSDGKRCVECPNGQTSFEGASRCSTLLDICPAPNTCQKGYERVNGTCNKCLQGTYSPNGLKCLPCDNGKTSFEGAAECTILPGTCPKPPVITDPICLTNETWNGSSCVRNGGGGGGGESCKLGQYISGSTCLDCPAGTFGANPPGNGLGSCRYCPSNTYSIAGSASCIACSSVQTWNGYSCVDNTVYKTPITNCKPGQELSADKECTKCSAGYGSLGDECIEIIKYLYANPNKVLQGAKSKLYYEIINDDETKKIIEGISKCKITDITTPANTLSAISIAKGSVETSQITDPTKYELSCPNTTPRTTNVNIYSRGEV